MAKPQFNWTCPYCDHAVTVTEANYRIGSVELWLREGVSSGGTYPMHVEIIDCPNNACGKSTLTFCINTTAYKCIPSGPISLPQSRGGSLRQKWTLLPQSDATIYPDYVPEAVRTDYTEACLIRDFSPKASATLARRCLQGMIRDFHGVVKDRLVDEITGIKDKVEPNVWEAIDGVRQIGNIGAHMEKDVNVMIDVDPEEASILLELIEMLIEDWYVGRHQRNESVRRVKDLADAKKSIKKGRPPGETP